MLRFLRTRVFPWTVWLGAMGTAGWLWHGVHFGSARGFVEPAEYGVTTPLPGRVASLGVQVGQQVRAGDVVAVIESQEIEAEIEMLAAERRRVEAELGAVEDATQVEVGEFSRRLEESVDAAELARSTARAEQKVRAAELAAINRQVDVVRELVDKRMADRRDLVEIEVNQATVKKELEQTEKLVRQLDGQVAAARNRRTGVPVESKSRATDPLRAELLVLISQQQMLKVQQESMVLRAPADGEVTAVYVHAHEVAMPGLPIATISGSARSATVVACLDEVQAAKISTGEAARLRAIDGTGELHHAHVTRMSPSVGHLPLRCWRDPKIPSWGRTADLALDEPADLMPGQGFAIDFLGRRSEHGTDSVAVRELEATAAETSTVAAGTADRQDGAIAMVVPAALNARTRFEPSGLVWVPALDRYVMVSDDTGQPDADDHAPWLFTMDKQGHVDEQPLVVDGIDKLNDLESIAAAPDGGLYVFSSQSHSRKGKRPRHRQQLVRVAFDAGRPRATAVVVFADLLDGAGTELFGPLGIASTAELEIEGLTTTAAGGLLLGLKSPASGSGKALVWHMADPEAMFASGQLQAAGLSLWAEIPLQVQADGKTSRAGIAELLELPDGSLLVAATANTAADPAQQDGALFLVGGRAQAGSPTRVRTFPGLKPEGLAVAADGKNVIVAFDLGTRTPLWMELPWPPA